MIGDETYVWKITNRKWNEPSDTTDRTLLVEPVIVKTSPDVIPLLGKWNFVPVEFAEGANIALKHDLITGQLVLPAAVSDVRNWKKRKVILEQTDWMLRSGDVVQVAIPNANSAQGLYVPMSAVLSEDGATYIHVVEPEGSSVRRVAVEVVSQNLIAKDSVLLQIKPLEMEEFKEGMQIVVGGTHYLNDGDHVRVVEFLGANQ